MFSVKPPTLSMNSKEAPFSFGGEHNAIQEALGSNTGLVSSDSVLYTAQKNCYVNPSNCNSFFSCNDLDDHDQNPLCHFIDERPKNQSNRTNVTWPEEIKSDWTQLSMSIPMASSNFALSPTSSKEKVPLSTLSPPHEFDPAPMSSFTQKQATDWMPISWKNSMGGPLGEVLNTSSTTGRYVNEAEMNQVTVAFDGKYNQGYSPTGVLQKASLVSLSNTSSSASSPRASIPSL